MALAATLGLGTVGTAIGILLCRPEITMERATNENASWEKRRLVGPPGFNANCGLEDFDNIHSVPLLHKYYSAPGDPGDDRSYQIPQQSWYCGDDASPGRIHVDIYVTGHEWLRTPSLEGVPNISQKGVRLEFDYHQDCHAGPWALADVTRNRWYGDQPVSKWHDGFNPIIRYSQMMARDRRGNMSFMDPPSTFAVKLAERSAVQGLDRPCSFSCRMTVGCTIFELRDSRSASAV